MLSLKQQLSPLFKILLISIIILFSLSVLANSILIDWDKSAAISIEPLINSSPRQALVSFTNVTPQVGLSGVSGNFYSWGDYNNDGNQDLLINGGRLFKNSGAPHYTFTEVTEDVGITGGGNGAWADYDNDGNLDFYCTGTDTLWHNEGAPGYNFKDVTVQAGNIKDDYPTTAIGWGDYDLDGYLDMYIANGEDWNNGDPIYYPDFLYHNNGNGTFTDVTEHSGIRGFGGPYYGRGVSWGDYNNNGLPDIYISNYRISQNWLFHNNGNGTFTDVAFDKGVTGEESQRLGNTYYGHTVGSAWADLDNDGDLDLFESNLVHKDLYRGPICGDSQIYRNNGPTEYDFTDVRADSNIPEKDLGGGEDELYVGIAMGDFDNDGYQDFFIPQIYDLEYSYSYLYHNNGDWTFTNVSDDVGVLVWNTYGGSWCDYNNDGFLDLITGGKGSADPNATYEVHLYRNNGNTNSWLHVKLQGKHYNKQGIGVRVKVTGNGFSQIREIEGGMGCHSQQNSIPVEFGFSEYSGTVEVEVYWPSGFIQKLENVQLNQLLVIEETTQAPDLKVINIKVLEEYPIQGDNVTLEASVANMGYLEADRAIVRFYDGALPWGIELGEAQEINNIKKFSSITVSTYWDTTGQEGEHELWAVIDEVEPAELVITNNELKCIINIREKNEVPIAALTVTPLEKLMPGDTVLFNASNSTDDIKVDYYNFDFGDGNKTGWMFSSIFEYQYQYPGKFVASLKVKDSDEAISTNSVQVKITINEPPIPNRPPVIESYTCNPQEIAPGENSILKVIAHDPDNDELKYYFQANSGELSTQEFKSTATWRAPPEEGIYTITAKVSDGELFSKIETIDIKVRIEWVNHPPEITEIVLNPTQVNVGDVVELTVSANDPDPDDVLTFDYEISAGEIIGTGNKVSWQAPDIPGAYIIIVTVKDQGELSTQQETMITVIPINYLPEILDARAVPNNIKNDETTTVLFLVEIEDKNGLEDVYQVTIDLSSIGGKEQQKLYDNGKYGDELNNDGIYSYEYVVSEGINPGSKVLRVSAQDYSLNQVSHELILNIQSGEGKIDNALTPGFEMNTIIICLLSFIIYFSMRKIPQNRK